MGIVIPDTLLVGVVLGLGVVFLPGVSFIQWGIWYGGIFAVGILDGWLKQWVGADKPWKQRPACAGDCGVWPSSKPVPTTPRPGFPSGHSAVAMYYVLGLAWLLSFSPWMFMIGLSWVGIVVAQRLQSCCHTIPQVAAGLIVGCIAAIGMIWINHIINCRI